LALFPRRELSRYYRSLVGLRAAHAGTAGRNPAQLVAAVQRNSTLSQATLAAAQAAENAAHSVEAAVVAVTTCQAASESQRRARHEKAKAWDLALAVLKRAARTAEDNGAAGLYQALFGRSTIRSRAKAKQPSGNNDTA